MLKNRIIALGLSALISTLALTGCSFGSGEGQQEYQTDVNSIVYNTLTENQKSMYRDLTNGVKNYNEKIELSGTLDDIKIVYEAMIADHPEVFYTDGYVYNEKKTLFGKSTNKLVMYPNYLYDENEVATIDATIEKEANALVAGIDMSASDYEKSEAAYEALLLYTEYDATNDTNQTVASTFMNKKSGCGGYAQAYSLLLQKLNIPSATITGTLSDMAHMWNVSVLDGKNYLSDPTNGDITLISAKGNESAYVNYGYLNIHPDFTANYVPNELFSGIEFVDTDANYFMQHGLFFESYNADMISAAINSAKERGDASITVAFKDAIGLRIAESDLFSDKRIQSLLNNLSVDYMVNDSVNTLTIML